jgi:hypothetical protein
VGLVGSPTDEAYVHFGRPDHRSRGLGRRLYGMFFDEARQRGCRSVRAITSPINTGSVGFHTSMGFEVIEGDRTQDGVSIHSDYNGGKDKVGSSPGNSPGEVQGFGLAGCRTSPSAVAENHPFAGCGRGRSFGIVSSVGRQENRGEDP